MQQCIKVFIIPYLYEAQHVSGDTPPIIRSLKLHWQPLVFHTWGVVGRADGGSCLAHCAWQRPPTTRPANFHVWKTRGCQCSFRLLMMGGVSPETCWASYRCGTIKIFMHCCIFLDFLYELYYDARIHEHQGQGCPFHGSILVVAAVTRCLDGCRFSLRWNCRVQGHDKRDSVFNDAFSNPKNVVLNCWMTGNFKLDILWKEVVVANLEVPSA